MDEIPAPEIQIAIDERRRVYRDKYHVVDTPYHSPLECANDCGYKATDYAIYEHCPKESRWLVVTNGDNEYHPYFLSYLDLEYDIIGFDWFTRHSFELQTIREEWYTKYHINREYKYERLEFRSHCEHLEMEECAVNRYFMNHNDLGIQIWNYERFMRENKTYSKFSPCENHDSKLIYESVYLDAWKLKHVPACYCSHSPNQWAECQRKGNFFNWNFN